MGEKEFKLLCAMHAKANKEILPKSEFLNLFTPFDKSVYYNVGDRSYHLLSLQQNKKAYDSYLANTYLYKPKPETAIIAEDPRLKEVANRMQNLMGDHTALDNFTRKDLKVTSDGKVVYDISKKMVPYHNITGFRENFDDYHKMLYHESREEAHDLILDQVLNKPTNIRSQSPEQKNQNIPQI